MKRAACPALPAALLFLAATAAAAEPPRLFEWERGIALQQQGRDDLTMYLWFYEWNIFDAMSAGQHTKGSYQTTRTVAPDGRSAAVSAPGLHLTVETTPDGARLTLRVTNLSGRDWPETAAIIPCWNPGQVPGTNPSSPLPLNVNFADRDRDRSYFQSEKGLTLLDSRAIHFHNSWRPALDRIAPDGTFAFSYKWPTSEVNATSGVLLRESADRTWVTGIGWEDSLSVQGHNPWSCLHASIRVGGLKAGESKTVRGRLFLFPGSRRDGLERFRKEFPTGKALPAARDLRFFLRRLRTLDHLPELEDSHTAMASTWDRTGGNRDGVDFKNVEGNRNVLLDVDGPGCVHRIFTGRLGAKVEGTRIQVFLDRAEKPAIDLDVNRFFDDKEGPFPYPLVFHKTYPGMLFPIPFQQHCRIQLVSSEPDPGKRRWGNFWQVTYTHYPTSTAVRSLRWPPNADEQEEIEAVRQAWLAAESAPPAPPAAWSVDRDLRIAPGKTEQLSFEGRGVIREMRLAVEPANPETLRSLRLRMAWDGSSFDSVDVPVGYFFGHAGQGHQAAARYNSLVTGVTETEAWSRFPMPFTGGAVLRLANPPGTPEARVKIRLKVERPPALQEGHGRFHATWTEARTYGDDLARAPRYGKLQMPVHLALERASGPGKYVGLLLHLAWPYPGWWGEGDWLIWTDEDGWPPSYHGTGSEEYFNSGWCEFDRKAVSGFVVKDRPGEIAVYTYHLNDAFQFRKNIRVAEEFWKVKQGREDIVENALWGSTAFWYALPAQPAGSRQDLLHPRMPPR